MLLSIHPIESGLRVEGELDIASAPRLTAAIAAVEPSAEIVLDFSAVSFMDSTGLRYLLEALRSNAERRLVLLDPSPAVRKVLGISLPGGVPGLEIRERT